MAAISHCHFDQRTQPVVVNNQELAAMRQEKPAFYAQVKRGIVLWEAIVVMTPRSAPWWRRQDEDIGFDYHPVRRENARGTKLAVALGAPVSRILPCSQRHSGRYTI
jgi:hypothetical protein